MGIDVNILIRFVALAGYLLTFTSSINQIQDDDALVPITVNNVHLIEQLEIFGRGEIQDFEWSPDGDTLAVASNAAGVWLYDANDLGKQPRLLDYVETVYYYNDIEFNSDWSVIAVALDYPEIGIWDFTTGQALATFEADGKFVFSPDDSLLAIGAKLYDTQTWELLADLVPGDGDYVSSPVFSPDGSLFATAHRGRLRLWCVNVSGCGDDAFGNELAEVEIERGVSSITFSPDSEILAIGAIDNNGLGYLSFWNVTTDEKFDALWLSYGSYISDLEFSPDGSMLAIGTSQPGHIVYLLDVQTYEWVQQFNVRYGAILKVAFRPGDGLVVAIANDICDGTGYDCYGPPALSLWDVQTGNQLGILDRHFNYISNAAFSPDDVQIAFGGRNGAIFVWDTRTNDLELIGVHEDSLANLAFSSDGTRLAAACGYYSPVIYIWDTNTWELTNSIEVSVDGFASSVILSDNGMFVAAKIRTVPDVPSILVWNTVTGELLADYTFREETFISSSSIWFGPDSQTIMIPSRLDPEDPTNYLITWHWRSNETDMWEFEGPEGRMIPHPDGERFIVLRANSVGAVSKETGHYIQYIEETFSFVDGAGGGADQTLSPDYTLLAIAYCGESFFWNIEAREKVFQMTGTLGPIIFNSDATLMASFGYTIKLWGVMTEE